MRELIQITLKELLYTSDGGITGLLYITFLILMIIYVFIKFFNENDGLFVKSDYKSINII